MGEDRPAGSARERAEAMAWLFAPGP